MIKLWRNKHGKLFVLPAHYAPYHGWIEVKVGHHAQVPS